MSTVFQVGSLVRARGREWVVLPESAPDFLVLRPLGGSNDDTAGVFPALETVESATFPPPGTQDLGDASSGSLLRTALRIGFRSTAGPFRSLASLAVEPRAYQFVPLLMALRQETVRLLIADDVGIGKTIEAGLIATELLAQGDIQRLAVLCSPALAEQWQDELREKFSIDAELVLPSTIARLSRGLLMGESLFEKYPFVVVSTDFIKSPSRIDEFVRVCPELVIVDEAHTAVSDGSPGVNRKRTQRHDLLRKVAQNKTRHLILLTATPHSGKEEGFRNLLALLDPTLATADLEDVKSRERLARHFIQRRRGAIRAYLNEETLFPKDRLSREVPYDLTPAYARLFDQVLAYAREQVGALATDGRPTVHQRVRWWSALALLRALSSSPKAAATTLRTRASSVGASSVEEADALGRASVLDEDEAESLDALDAPPGADPLAEEEDSSGAQGTSPATNERRRLRELARAADTLLGVENDRKLATLITEVRALLSEGYNPIVFCRFIDTAEYVAEHLRAVLSSGVRVAAVTGRLPASERADVVATFAAGEGRHVLVAADCLSEGVNLQDSFQAVVHYDLAWNPTRHEQREGRVDRFGQTREVVKAVTLFGRDNQIDGIVLEVLLRKHEAIRRATGVSVPVPDQSDGVVQALIEGLVLRGKQSPRQVLLDVGMDERRDALFRAWESAASREGRWQGTKYEQASIHPEEVMAELRAAQSTIGSSDDLVRFTSESLRALGSSLTPQLDGFEAVTTTLPIGLRDALPTEHHGVLRFHADLPVPRGEQVLARTDPAIEGIARYVLDTALDDKAADGHRRVASRAGAMRTAGVSVRTTLLLVRFRFQMEIPGRAQERAMVAEDARLMAFEGSPDHPVWLTPARVEELASSPPGANLPVDQAVALFERSVGALAALTGELDAVADRLADELLESHRRVRASAGAARRGLRVVAQKPVDILGLYVYLPLLQGGAR